MKVMIEEFRSSKSIQVVFTLSLLFFLALLGLAEQYRYHYERVSLHKIANAYAFQIQNSVNHALSVLHPIAATIRVQQGKMDSFDILAKELMPLYPCADSLQLAPNGIVSAIFPLKGNEKAIGHNLFADLHRNKEAFLAKKTKQLTLAGPFELLQGGLGLAGRLPIFLNDEQTADSFWGFAIVIVRVPEIFNRIDFRSLEDQGIAYRINRIHPDTGKEHVILASRNSIINNPVSLPIHVPNTNWTLSISPEKGWLNLNFLVFGTFFCILSALLLTAFIMYLRKRKENTKLRFIAHHDNLTHLPNRILLTDRFKHSYARSKQTQTYLAVCFIDLDHFKEVNDTYTHEAGDHILIETTQRILKCIREEDTLSRHGGDEFILLIGNMHDQHSVLEIIERILDTLSSPYHVDETTTVALSASIGITFASETVHDLEVLIQQADSAMYEAKAKGRNTFAHYLKPR